MSLSLLLSRLSIVASPANPRLVTVAAAASSVATRRHMSGNELGRGAGKGGGAGGSIREAGGSMGKSQAAKEEEYFRRLERDQFSAMQKSLSDEVEYHEREIAHHLKAIKKHKVSMGKLDSDKDHKDKNKDGKGEHRHHDHDHDHDHSKCDHKDKKH